MDQRPQIHLNPDGSFMNADQIFEDLKTRVDCSPHHPDNYSAVVMSKFHAWLKETPQP